MIFVDTSFWIALRIRADARHEDASSLVDVYGDGPLLTTSHVIGETWTVLARQAGHASAVGFLDAVERSPRVEVVHVPEALEHKALGWLRRNEDRIYSFVDATSFALMRSRRIRRALTFDRDFAAAGFEQLRSPS